MKSAQVFNLNLGNFHRQGPKASHLQQVWPELAIFERSRVQIFFTKEAQIFGNFWAFMKNGNFSKNNRGKYCAILYLYLWSHCLPLLTLPPSPWKAHFIRFVINYLWWCLRRDLDYVFVETSWGSSNLFELLDVKWCSLSTNVCLLKSSRQTGIG